MLLPVNSILNLAVCSTLPSPSSKVDTLSAQLLLPYLGWTSFAAVSAAGCTGFAHLMRLQVGLSSQQGPATWRAIGKCWPAPDQRMRCTAESRCLAALNAPNTMQALTWNIYLNNPEVGSM